MISQRIQNARITPSIYTFHLYTSDLLCKRPKRSFIKSTLQNTKRERLYYNDK